MRAGGLSPGRIVGAVLKLAGGAVVALFLLAQFVIPPAQQLAHAERASRLSSSEAVRSGNSFWAAGDHQFLNVRRFDNGNIRVKSIYMSSPRTASCSSLPSRSCGSSSGWHLAVGGCVDQALQRHPN